MVAPLQYAAAANVDEHGLQRRYFIDDVHAMISTFFSLPKDKGEAQAILNQHEAETVARQQVSQQHPYRYSITLIPSLTASHSGDGLSTPFGYRKENADVNHQTFPLIKVLVYSRRVLLVSFSILDSIIIRLQKLGYSEADFPDNEEWSKILYPTKMLTDRSMYSFLETVC